MKTSSYNLAQLSKRARKASFETGSMSNKLENKKVAVLGLGLEGKDLVKFLLKQKSLITIFDQKREKELDLTGIEAGEVRIVCGKDYLSGGLSGFDIVFRSPGFYRYLVQLIEAEKQGVEISSATKLFFELCPAKIIGVTGTKGKGTTSTLIYEILKASGKRVFLAGNIGKPYLELLPKLKKEDFVILELSSFQLIDLEKSPQIAIVLNITLDHLDWHGDINEYIAAKSQIVRHQQKNDIAVINADYQIPLNFAKFTKSNVYYFSKKKKTNGCYIEKGRIILAADGKKIEIGKTNDLSLRGQHNWENVTAAICAAYLAGAKINAIKKAVFSFKGLEHRLELVGKVKGIAFYNDSFATNPQPTIAAVNSFSEPITLILGGSDKGLNYDGMAKVLSKKKNLRTVVLIGEISKKIKKSLYKAGFKGKIVDLGKTTMKRIVKTAFKQTPRGGVVLLSPATASFDMFKDYKDRGNQFKEAVRMLKNEEG